jgi:hypothetical protein
MRFSGIITPGDILIAMSILVSVFGAYNRIVIRLTNIETKIEPVYSWWDRHVNNGNGPNREHSEQRQGAD